VWTLTYIVHQFVLKNRKCWKELRRGKNALQDAFDEYNNAVMNPYENKKKLANGPVSELDNNERVK
jgi:hypothetical protein